MIQSLENVHEEIASKSNPILDLTFKQLTYTVSITDNISIDLGKSQITKTIVNDVSGIFKGSQLSVIMGSSGSGKTTLLNLIAGRVSSGKIQGEKAINGQPYNYQSFGDFANYVMQKDVLFQTLTVMETLEFAAELKLSVSSEEKKKRIESLVKKLKLEKCVDVLVGGALLKGISGGEKKRTSIAFELLSDPAVLILDEPTSGLDSLTSFIIVQYLKELARTEGKTVVMTIHQPNAQIYALFDRLLLLVEGRLIYQGAAKEAKEYFAEHFGLVCPQFHNPADYFMSVMHHQIPENCKRFPLYFEAYDNFVAPKVEKQLSQQSHQKFEQRLLEIGGWHSFSGLLSRDYKNLIRNPLLIKVRFLSTTLLTLYAAGLYYRFNGDYTNDSNWRSLVGFTFVIPIGMLILALAPVALVFPSEREVFLKEESSKMYNTFSYFMSRSVVQLPYTILFPIISLLISYWFVGLSSTAVQIFTSYLVIFLVTFAGSSLGLMIGSIVTDSKTVTVLIPITIYPAFAFAGFFKNLENLPSWIGWIQYLSPIRYSFEARIQNQVQFAAESKIALLNLNLSSWSSIGLLIVLGLVSFEPILFVENEDQNLMIIKQNNFLLIQRNSVF